MATPATPWEELDAVGRRRIVLVAVARCVLISVAMLGAYLIIATSDVTPIGTLLRLVGGSVLLLLAFFWQLRSIQRSTYPNVRAAEAVVLSFLVVIVVFAGAYVGFSQLVPGSFDEPLDAIDGLYFTVTVISTVGFGDIVPVGDGARLLVTAQMLVDLVLIGVVVRLFLARARNRLQARR